MCFNSIETSIRLKENLATEVCKHQMKKLGYNLQRPLFNLCQESNTLFTEAINGFKQGITQCNRSFGRMRWNCTNQSTGKINVLFGIVMARGSREAAVMFAMASAGMVERIASESYRERRRKKNQTVRGCYQLHGARNARAFVSTNDCDTDIDIGDTYARKVMENWLTTQKSSNEENLMNIHNARVGRLAVRQHMKKVCKCNGLSGACNALCCYKDLRPLSVSTAWLKKQYKNAKKVKTGPRLKRDGFRLLVTAKDSIAPEKADLIYLHDSPNYCLHDPRTGSLGTTGRQCRLNTNDTDNCDSMCCGRGYETHVMARDEQCKCTFIWCCEVKCQTCRRLYTIHRCK